MIEIWEQPQHTTDVYKKPIDKSLIKRDYQGNYYVGAYDTLKIADDAFDGKWSLEVVNHWCDYISDLDIIFNATVRISVPGLGHRTAIGSCSLRSSTLKSPANKDKKISELELKDFQLGQAEHLYKKAVTDGMKKALSYFQICAEVYDSPDETLLKKNDTQKKPKTRVGKLSDNNKEIFKAIAEENNLKILKDLNSKLDEIGITELNDSTFDQFKKHFENKSIPV